MRRDKYTKFVRRTLVSRYRTTIHCVQFKIINVPLSVKFRKKKIVQYYRTREFIGEILVNVLKYLKYWSRETYYSLDKCQIKKKKPRKNIYLNQKFRSITITSIYYFATYVRYVNNNFFYYSLIKRLNVKRVLRTEYVV